MRTRASNSELVKPLPEPEQTLNQRLYRKNRRVLFEQRNNQPQHPRIVYPPISDINYFRHFVELLNHNTMDDQPMWDGDCVVALTPNSAITLPATVNEFAIKDTKNEAVSLIAYWRYKNLVRRTFRRNNRKLERFRTPFISRFFPPALFDRLLQEIRAFSQHEGETLTDAWLRMKEVLINCHGHNLSKGGIIKIIYHCLSETTQEVLNATAGGPSKTDTKRIMARMDAITMKMDAQYKELQSQSK
ncbi:hypothetical protein Tco_0501926 [Tanacetum coccineum]